MTTFFVELILIFAAIVTMDSIWLGFCYFGSKLQIQGRRATYFFVVLGLILGFASGLVLGM